MSHPCTNFRDVAEAIELVADRAVVRPGALLRGGKIDFVATFQDIGTPGTIVNLRKAPDPAWCGVVRAVHLPAPSKVDVYDTSHHRVRRWLADVLDTLSSPSGEWPVLIHCASGKDRTGVVIAAILWAIGIERRDIVGEYLLSDGEIDESWIQRALDGLEGSASPFRCDVVEAIRVRLCLE